MTMALSRHGKISLPVSLVLLLFLSWASTPSSARAATILLQASGDSGGQLSPGQQLVKETREAAGEDKGAFKHSSSVQWISQHTGLSVEAADWVSELFNFGVIALAILWLSKKYLPTVFRNRNISIQKAMEDARKASEDANRRLADIESRLSKIDSEIGQRLTKSSASRLRQPKMPTESSNRSNRRSQLWQKPRAAN